MATTADNRHGEPAEKHELRDAGVDSAVGLSTKNVGGGTVRIGGHTVGRYDPAEKRVVRSIRVGAGCEAGVISGTSCESHPGSPEVLYAAGEVAKIVAHILVPPKVTGHVALFELPDKCGDTA